MRVEYDAEADAVYFSLTPVQAGQSASQLAVEDEDLKGYIILDFDTEMRLLGIEIVGCETVLTRDVLEQIKRNNYS